MLGETMALFCRFWGYWGRILVIWALLVGFDEKAMVLRVKHRKCAVVMFHRKWAGWRWMVLRSGNYNTKAKDMS